MEDQKMMNIRILDSTDAAAWQELRLFALQEAPETFLTTYEDAVKMPLSTVEQRLAPSENAFTFGAFNEEGLLIGMVTLIREAAGKLRHRGLIVAMYVHPSGRRAGTGRALMEAAIAKARELPGLHKVNLSLSADNHRARSLYLSLGFKPYGYERDAMLEGDRYADEEHMALFL